MRAFIFASSYDAAPARLCRDRLLRQDVDSVIVFDANDPPSEVFPGELFSSFERNGRLFGVSCAAGISSIMAENSNGHDVLAKIDADTALSDDGITWLKSATHHAHGFSLGLRSKWSGIWAAPSNVFAVAAKRLPAATDCTGCPEAHLFWSFFKAHCGIRRMTSETVQVWRSGRSINKMAALVTLPSGLPRKERLLEAIELLTTA